MSVDYYMICDGCKKAIHVAQDGLSGFTFYSGEPDCMKKLAAFLDEHGTICGGSGPQFVDEGVVDVQGYEEVPWTRNK